MFFVYLDFTNNGEVFYVGKGNESRCLNSKRNERHQIISKEEEFNRAVVFESENEQKCLQKEIELISEYHTWYLDPLRSDNACNFTLGGEGSSGYRHKYTEKQCQQKTITNQKIWAATSPDKRSERNKKGWATRYKKVTYKKYTVVVKVPKVRRKRKPKSQIIHERDINNQINFLKNEIPLQIRINPSNVKYILNEIHELKKLYDQYLS